jgi:uncharacterized protein YciI
MFVIELTYKAPLTELDACMKAHVAFLEEQYAAGRFIVSGRQVPRTGGIIIATANSRAEVEQIMRRDPFAARGLADLRIVEFRASQRAADLPKRMR